MVILRRVSPSSNPPLVRFLLHVLYKKSSDEREVYHSFTFTHPTAVLAHIADQQSSRSRAAATAPQLRPCSLLLNHAHLPLILLLPCSIAALSRAIAPISVGCRSITPPPPSPGRVGVGVSGTRKYHVVSGGVGERSYLL
jgi:hypothetical protein